MPERYKLANWLTSRHGSAGLARTLRLGLILMFLAQPSHAQQQVRVMVKPTNYPVPPAAVFVSPVGDDSNPGDRLSPLRTISHAIGIAADGGTIVVREGTYREALPEITKRLTLQPYPRERVWLKGSIIVTGWVRDGAIWRRDEWRHAFCDRCYHRDNIDPSYPYAGLPDQVFLDGAPMRQVAGRSAVTTGTFFVEREHHRLFLGSDPAGRTVEASVHTTALVIGEGARGSMVRGLGIAHYSPAAKPGLGGAVIAKADNVTFENNMLAWNAVKGLEVFAENATVSGNTFVYNGMMGLGAWRASGLAVTGNRFLFNNRERFAQTGHVSEAAGAKITASSRVRVTDNLFNGNFASGLWLDINVSDAVIARNLVRNNSRHGIHYEISSNAIIASNIVVANGVSGIAAANSSGLKIYNNTLVDNPIALVVQDDGRVNTDSAEVRLGNTWRAGDTEFFNNLVAGADRFYIWVRDFSGRQDAGTMLTRSDRNGIVLRCGSQTRFVVEWWQRSGPKRFSSLEQYRSSTGRDVDSEFAKDCIQDPFFVDAEAGNFALLPDSRARNAGRNLPPDVMDAIGVTDGRSPKLGALHDPGWMQ